ISIQSHVLRVLMVTPFYFPSMGGVENHVYQVARRLAHANIDITVLTTDRSGQLPEEEQIAGVKILRVPALPANRDYYFAPGIAKIIMQGKWDIVHLQCYHTLVAPLAMAAAWAARIPYVVTFHGGGNTSQLRNRLRGIQQRLLRPFLAQAKRLIAVANFEIDYYGGRLNLAAERFALIPNGCDLPKLADDAAANSDNLLVSIGRLEQYKGHHRIIAAMPYILDQYPKMRLRILGEGPYKPALQEQVSALGLDDCIEIAGIPATERTKMAELLTKASVVTLLSDYETHPIAALEALSLKRPVLAADTSGLRELAERGLVRSVPINCTPQTVAKAVIEQIEDPLIPAKLDLPTWDDCARELLFLYRGITGRF
ncbi:MAG: glycosyltransferase family 4 protein, partial [Caldilineaceae bacterium]|nr:glycosyltransferase family 4 protein [Caldilineaceae bacterium]